MMSVSWSVIGSGIAAVGVTAGPARSRAELQPRAPFIAIISGVTSLLDFAGALQQLVVDHQEVLTITLDVKLLS